MANACHMPVGRLVQSTGRKKPASRNGVPVDEPFLRDIVNVPYWDGNSLKYPSVTLRMDFRDPHTVGTFIYHCHLLEHEDGGMMGTIRVER